MAIIRRKFSVSELKSLSRLSINYRNTMFYVLKQVHVLLTCHAVLDVINKQFIVCKHLSDSLAVKMTSFRQGDH